jgi:hypothetical protein
MANVLAVMMLLISAAPTPNSRARGRQQRLWRIKIEKSAEAGRGHRDAAGTGDHGQQPIASQVRAPSTTPPDSPSTYCAHLILDMTNRVCEREDAWVGFGSFCKK